MTPKEIIRKVVGFDSPPRIGHSYSYGHHADIVGANFRTDEKEEYQWQNPSFFADAYPGYADFNGFLKKDAFGNLWGKMWHDATGGGETLEGVLSSWDQLDDYAFPDWDNPERYLHLEEEIARNRDKYVTGWLVGFPFAITRNMRKLEIFLMDLILERERIDKLHEKCVCMLEGMIDNYGRLGVDAVFFCEDWGTQDRLLISPAMWRDIYKPIFKRLCGRAHRHGMKVFMHSCGYIYEILDDLIESGVDVLQLDQPGLMGLDRLAEKIAGRATLFSSCDIQRVLPTGDKALIEEHARQLVEKFHRNGGFIAKDYGDYRTIQVEQEWAGWMRSAFARYGGNY
ncbi:MAG: uroporphyrinogen decarboxylase family protein [Clostridia bacterium]